MNCEFLENLIIEVLEDRLAEGNQKPFFAGKLQAIADEVVVSAALLSLERRGLIAFSDRGPSRNHKVPYPLASSTFYLRRG